MCPMEFKQKISVNCLIFIYNKVQFEYKSEIVTYGGNQVKFNYRCTIVIDWNLTEFYYMNGFYLEFNSHS